LFEWSIVCLSVFSTSSNPKIFFLVRKDDNAGDFIRE
jgi:hypothetical protein